MQVITIKNSEKSKKYAKVVEKTAKSTLFYRKPPKPAAKNANKSPRPAQSAAGGASRPQPRKARCPVPKQKAAPTARLNC
jgi:hypothetical protein